MQKWKYWELTLLFIAAAILLPLALGGHEQRALAEQVIRLHVLAHSDGVEDQRLKLRVRDAVLSEAERLLDGADSPAAASARLGAHLYELTAAGQRAVLANGAVYPVRVRLCEQWFPTRHYTDFSLPAGRYQSLRVEIGAAQGHNWWCVVYPPLCSVGIEEAEPVSLGLNPEQVRLITDTEGEYLIRFRCMELWGELEQRLTG